nr:EamA family transporter [Actinomyces oris]
MILGKAGITGVEFNLGTSIRTRVVLVVACVMLAVTRRPREVRSVLPSEFGFALACGIVTCTSWLCCYEALQDGRASMVVTIDRTTVFVAVLFSAFALQQTAGRRSLVGLFFLVARTLSAFI